jgi:hypothetical protein
MARVGGAGLEAGKEKAGLDGVSEFLRRWKYQLAFVPAMLLLCIVAVQAYRMAVHVPTNVVVPTGKMTAQVIQNVQPQAGGKQEIGAVEAEEEAVQSATSIKTFAGRTVLPPSYYLQKNQEMVQEEPVDHPVLQFNSEKTFENEVTSAGGTATAAVNAVEENKTPEAVLAEQAAEWSGDLRYLPMQTTAYKQPSKTERISSSGNAEQAKENVGMEALQIKTESGEVPADGVGNTVQTGSRPLKVEYTAPVTQEALEVKLTAPAPAAGASAGGSEVAEPEAADMEVSEPEPMLMQIQDSVDKAFVEVNVPAQIEKSSREAKPAAQINYEGDFSDDEKADIEKNLIPLFTEKSDVTAVNISKRDLGVTAAEVIRADGSREEKLFKKSDASGKWDEVKYVKRYYYDNGLSYVRLDLYPLPVYVYPPLYYSPLKYPYRYYYGY